LVFPVKVFEKKKKKKKKRKTNKTFQVQGPTSKTFGLLFWVKLHPFFPSCLSSIVEGAFGVLDRHFAFWS
jgi:hypothetical protein